MCGSSSWARERHRHKKARATGMKARYGTGGISLLLLAVSGTLLHAGEPGKPAGPLDVEPEDLQPGLVALYRSVNDPDARLARTDAKPAFSLGHSSPHPRIPPRPIHQ